MNPIPRKLAIRGFHFAAEPGIVVGPSLIVSKSLKPASLEKTDFVVS